MDKVNQVSSTDPKECQVLLSKTTNSTEPNNQVLEDKDSKAKLHNNLEEVECKVWLEVLA